MSFNEATSRLGGTTNSHTLGATGGAATVRGNDIFNRPVPVASGGEPPGLRAEESVGQAKQLEKRRGTTRQKWRAIPPPPKRKLLMLPPELLQGGAVEEDDENQYPVESNDGGRPPQGSSKMSFTAYETFNNAPQSRNTFYYNSAALSSPANQYGGIFPTAGQEGGLASTSRAGGSSPTGAAPSFHSNTGNSKKGWQMSFERMRSFARKQSKDNVSSHSKTKGDSSPKKGKSDTSFRNNFFCDLTTATEIVELQIESLTPFVSRLIFILWFAALIAAIAVQSIVSVQWGQHNICGDAFATNLRHIDRFTSACATSSPMATQPTPPPPSPLYNVQWKADASLQLHVSRFERFPRVVLSLAKPLSLAQTTTYNLAVAFSSVQLVETVRVAYNISVRCRTSKSRCDTIVLQEDVIFASTASDFSMLLSNVPQELAARADSSSVAIVFQKGPYTLGLLILRYIFLGFSGLHLIYFISCKQYTSTLYEQNWVIILQVGLMWYLNPLAAISVVTRPTPKVLSYLDLYYPSLFTGILIAFMFAVITASMSWVPRQTFSNFVFKLLFEVKSIYQPPLWTKLCAALYVVLVFVLNMIDAGLNEWQSDGNGDGVGWHQRVYWSLIAVLLLGALVCLLWLWWLTDNLGVKPYLDSRPQQLACRVFVLCFTTMFLYYIIEVLTFIFLHSKIPGTLTHQPFTLLSTIIVGTFFTNIMTLIYSTRRRSNLVPIHPRDQRWKFMVWPDTWYRWLSRHGGSMYIFFTEAEEINFNKTQFNFRKRQAMARQRSERQKKMRTEREKQRKNKPQRKEKSTTEHHELSTIQQTSPAANEDAGNQLPHESTMNSSTGTHHHHQPQPPPPPPQALPRWNKPDAAHTPNHELGSDGGAGGSTATTQYGAGASNAAAAPSAEQPAKRPKEMRSTRAGAESGNFDLRREDTLNMDTFSTFFLGTDAHLRKPGATTVVDPAVDSSQRFASTFHPQRARRSSSALLMKNLNPASRSAIPSKNSTLRADNRALLQAIASITAASKNNSFTGPTARRESVALEHPTAQLLKSTSSCLPPSNYVVSRRNSVDNTLPVQPENSYFVRVRRVHGKNSNMGSQRATETISPEPSGTYLMESTVRDGSIMPEQSQRFEGFHDASNVYGHESASVAPTHLDSTHQRKQRSLSANPSMCSRQPFGTSELDDTCSTSTSTSSSSDSATSGMRRGYSSQWRSDSTESSSLYDSDEDSNSGKIAAVMRPFRRAIRKAHRAVGNIVTEAERNLVERPVKAFDAFENNLFDVAFRPFQNKSYLPFFNLETAIDCYNMSWEAYGLAEPEMDAANTAEVGGATMSVPQRAAQGVRGYLMCCCLSSDDDDDDEEAAASAAAGLPGGCNPSVAVPIADDSSPSAASRRPLSSPKQKQQHQQRQETHSLSAASEEVPRPGDAGATHVNHSMDETITRAVNASLANGAMTTRSGTGNALVTPPPANDPDAPPPMDLGKYGYKEILVFERISVQVVIAKMDTSAPEHAGKAPRIIVAFRGTSNVDNAMMDMKMGFRKWKEVDDVPLLERARLGGESAAVHGGFLKIWKAQRTIVLDAVRKELDSNPDIVYRVFCTGHSLGGGLASLAAYSLHKMLCALDYPIKDLTVYTFGQPRGCNRAFQAAYDKAVPRTFRVVNESDLVALFNYPNGHHVGTEVDIDRNGNYVCKPTYIERAFRPTKGKGLAVMNHLMTAYGASLNTIADKTTCQARCLLPYLDSNYQARQTPAEEPDGNRTESVEYSSTGCDPEQRAKDQAACSQEAKDPSPGTTPQLSNIIETTSPATSEVVVPTPKK